MGYNVWRVPEPCYAQCFANSQFFAGSVQLASADDSPFDWVVPSSGTHHLVSKLGTSCRASSGTVVQMQVRRRY
jgi:hypothetical protein